MVRAWISRALQRRAWSRTDDRRDIETCAKRALASPCERSVTLA
jgi:hypothetical protein